MHSDLVWSKVQLMELTLHLQMAGHLSKKKHLSQIIFSDLKCGLYPNYILYLIYMFLGYFATLPCISCSFFFILVLCVLGQKNSWASM